MGYPKLLWQNRIEGLSVTASAEDAGFPGDNVATWREYYPEIWTASGAASYTLRIDLGSDMSMDSFGLVNHNFGSQALTGILIEAATQAAGWGGLAPLVPSFTTPNDLTLAKFFASVNRRYIQLTLSKGDIFTPRLGILFVGNALEFPQLPDQPYDPLAEESVSSREYGSEGHLLGVIEDYTMRKQSLSFSYLLKTWCDSTWLPLWRAHRNKPFLWAWDPDDHPLEVYLMEFQNPGLSMPPNNIYKSLPLDLRGRLEE